MHFNVKIKATDSLDRCATWGNISYPQSCLNPSTTEINTANESGMLFCAPVVSDLKEVARLPGSLLSFTAEEPGQII